MLTTFEIIILILIGLSAIVLFIFIAIGLAEKITKNTDTTTKKKPKRIK